MLFFFSFTIYYEFIFIFYKNEHLKRNSASLGNNIDILFFCCSNHSQCITIWSSGNKLLWRFQYWHSARLQPKPSTLSEADHQVSNSSSSNSSSTSSLSSESSDTLCSDFDTDDSVSDKDYVPDKEDETDETEDESLPRNQSLCPNKSKASQESVSVLVSPAKKGIKRKRCPETWKRNKQKTAAKCWKSLHHAYQRKNYEDRKKNETTLWWKM